MSGEEKDGENGTLDGHVGNEPPVPPCPEDPKHPLDAPLSTAEEVRDELEAIQNDIKLLADAGRTSAAKIRNLKPFLKEIGNLLDVPDLPPDLTHGIKQAHRRLNNTIRRLELAAAAGDDPNDEPTETGLTCRRVRLPTFKGDLRRWREWWAAYDAAIHSNNGIYKTKAAKMFQLLAYVEGAARDALPSKVACDDDYDDCISALKDRFGNPAALAQVYYSDLDALAPADESPASLRALYDQINDLISKLKSCNVNIDVHKIASAIFSRFPKVFLTNLIREHLRKAPGHELELQTMLTGLKLEIEVEEFYAARVRRDDATASSNSISVTLSATRRQASGDNDGKQDLPPPKRSRPPPTCTFCSKQHRTTDCKVHSTLEARISRLKVLKRCTSCTGPHIVDECRFRNNTCHHCQKKGHVKPLCSEFLKTAGSDGKGAGGNQ